MNNWNIVDTNITIPTISYKQNEIVKVNSFSNKVYRITGPNTDILLAAAQINFKFTSDDGQFLAILASRNYDIEYDLQDHFDPANFLIVYPYAVKYEGNKISECKFIAEGIEIKSIWSHPLSSSKIIKIFILNPMTSDIRMISETREDIRPPMLK